jgi:hypothetical protein
VLEIPCELERASDQAAAEDAELLEPLPPLLLDLVEDSDEPEEDGDEGVEDGEFEPFDDPEPLLDDEEDDRLSVR